MFFFVRDCPALLLELILRWKNFVLASPSLRFVMREFCLYLDCSSTASPNTLFFSLALRPNSCSDNCLLS